MGGCAGRTSGKPRHPGASCPSVASHLLNGVGFAGLTESRPWCEGQGVGPLVQECPHPAVSGGMELKLSAVAWLLLMGVQGWVEESHGTEPPFCHQGHTWGGPVIARGPRHRELVTSGPFLWPWVRKWRGCPPWGEGSWRPSGASGGEQQFSSSVASGPHRAFLVSVDVCVSTVSTC